MSEELRNPEELEQQLAELEFDEDGLLRVAQPKFGQFNGPTIEVKIDTGFTRIDSNGIDIFTGKQYQLLPEHKEKLANYYRNTWRKSFRSVGEMQQGEVEMIIKGVLQEESTCFLGALP